MIRGILFIISFISHMLMSFFIILVRRAYGTAWCTRFSTCKSTVSSSIKVTTRFMQLYFLEHQSRTCESLLFWTTWPPAALFRGAFGPVQPILLSQRRTIPCFHIFSYGLLWLWLGDYGQLTHLNRPLMIQYSYFCSWSNKYWRLSYDQDVWPPCVSRTGKMPRSWVSHGS